MKIGFFYSLVRHNEPMAQSLNQTGISHHFQREAKIMAGVFVLVVVFGILAAWLVPILQNHIAVDRCLDSGGSFNYKANKCELSKPTPNS